MAIEKHDTFGSTENTLVPVSEKYTLTIKETASYFSIGTKKMRRLAEDNRGRYVVCKAVPYQIATGRWKKLQFHHTIRGVLRPAFQMAVDDDILVKNPFGFQIAGVLVNDAVTRGAITKDQMLSLCMTVWCTVNTMKWCTYFFIRECEYWNFVD